MIKKIIAFFICSSQFLSLAQQGAITQGKMIATTFSYDSTKNAFVKVRLVRFLFTDSMVIAERDRANSYTNHSTGEHKQWRDVMGYVFVDLRSKSFYLYGTFSDTAQIQENYLQPAEGRPKGGWNFFKKSVSLKAGSIKLPDTVIGKTNFKRWKSFYSDDIGGTDTAFYVIRCLDCNNKVPFLNLGKISNEDKKCVYTRTEDVYLRRNIRFIDTMTLESKELTPKEKKVFAVWQRNAKNHPATVPKGSE